MQEMQDRKIYFLPSYIARAPSSRMRVYKIAHFLYDIGYSVKIIPCEVPNQDKRSILLKAKTNDIIYVQKWRTEFNAVEYLKEFKGKCKIVFDLDDLTGDKQALDLIEISDALIVGNHFLYNRYKDVKPTFIVPSAVDIKEYPIWTGEDDNRTISVAKCGIRHMFKVLCRMRTLLDKIHNDYPYELLLTGFSNATKMAEAQKRISFSKCLPLKTYDIYLQQIVPLLQKTTLGILPFSKRDNGKSGHSCLANLAMGVPTITTPFAECDYIIKDGVNGFLVDNEEEWYNKIRQLFEDRELRMKFRKEGWKTIRAQYDVPVVARLLVDCLEKV